MCPEAASVKEYEKHDGTADAIWVANGEQAYLPNVDSCCAVILPFANGALVGHAAMFGGEGFQEHQPAQNMQDVIDRMRGKLPEGSGEFKRIIFMGSTNEGYGYDLLGGTRRHIGETFGFGKPEKLRDMDRAHIVVDPGEGKYYAVSKRNDNQSPNSPDTAEKIVDVCGGKRDNGWARIGEWTLDTEQDV
jgi:hypothetical protein